MATNGDERLSYPLQRNSRASFRLNYNHWLLKEVTGSLLHPKIPVDNPNIRIADVATGTGIWALELASKLPASARIDAFDISPEQFPPVSWRDTKVQFSEQDCFEPFAPEFLGQFDVVHMRFMMCLVNNQDAGKLLKNIISLLKPGGYFQWVEPLPLSTKLVGSEGATSTAATEILVKLWKNPSGRSSLDWVAELPTSFEKNGLSVEAVDHIPLPLHYYSVWGHSLIAGFEENSSVDEDVVKKASAQKMAADLVKEFSEGVLPVTPFQVIVGRKLN